MGKSEHHQGDVDQTIIYVGFGAVMHQFQVIELTLWQFLTRTIEDRAAADQAMDRVEKWDATTFGAMVRSLEEQPHWPREMIDELEGAVATRNFLTHHFLREYYLETPSIEARDAAARTLADVADRLVRLEQSLEAQLKSRGIAIIDSLPGDIVDEIEALRPRTWLADRPLVSH